MSHASDAGQNVNVIDQESLPPSGRTCDSCGAPVDEDDRFCNACGAAQPMAAETTGGAIVQRQFRCETCGAEVSVDPQQRSYVCAFCESTYVVELPTAATGRQPPEFVIPFAISPQQVQERFRVWLSEGWFRPSDLRQAEIADKLRGVYLPFWSFSMLAQSHWRATIGEYWYRTETYTTVENGKTVTRTRRVQETEWWPLAGRHHRYYSGFLVSGSRGLSQADAERIKPFNLPALKRYAPQFLAGWLCEEYSVEREAALERCQQQFLSEEKQNIAAFLPGDTHRALEVETNFSAINSDLILLPVYLLRYRYQGKLYRFLANGQTGKIAGDKPYSKSKIVAAVATALVSIALVALLFWMLRR